MATKKPQQPAPPRARRGVPPPLLLEAIAALAITAPIYCATTTASGGIAITTRDGTFTWQPGSRVNAMTRDDFTVIPQIGRVTQADLYELGISTFAQLATTSTEILLTVMSQRALRVVHQYLAEHLKEKP